MLLSAQTIPCIFLYVTELHPVLLPNQHLDQWVNRLGIWKWVKNTHRHRYEHRHRYRHLHRYTHNLWGTRQRDREGLFKIKTTTDQVILERQLAHYSYWLTGTYIVSFDVKIYNETIKRKYIVPEFQHNNIKDNRGCYKWGMGAHVINSDAIAKYRDVCSTPISAYIWAQPMRDDVTM